MLILLGAGTYPAGLHELGPWNCEPDTTRVEVVVDVSQYPVSQSITLAFGISYDDAATWVTVLWLARAGGVTVSDEGIPDGNFRATCGIGGGPQSPQRVLRVTADLSADLTTAGGSLRVL